MNTPAKNRLEELFARAATLPPCERALFLDVECANQPELRTDVEELLRYHETSSFMSAQGSLEPDIQEQLARLKPEEPGERIGNYKLLKIIGEGGFGTVWLAEQEQPLRRQVALKIIKLGMDTREVIARFEQERQALAVMDHPNIARVFDAGATQFGRPYFVMEWVRGIRITDYCDEAKLTTPERMELFINVCQAVQHAHQKGIIHRDLKPSNILVMEQNGVPIPKVIDFGVAKAVEQRLTDYTIRTEAEHLIGTPIYMSPEQAEMNAANIDTRTDIYALGVVFYELLTGRPPFERAALLQAGFDEMRRIIREVEPPKPSTALRAMADRRLSETASFRGCESRRLIQAVSGDLDWIVMKALEKDRARRYATVNGLILDLERHARQEPVGARPPSQFYRFGRLVRRHRIVFAAVTVVIATLALGLSLALHSLAKERTALAGETAQREIAQKRQREATISESRAELLLYISDMNLVQEALRVNNLGRARRLLDKHRPKSGKTDLRGWEWRYLWQQCRSKALYSFHERSSRVLSVCFSPDSRLLAATFGDGVVEVWDVESRRRKADWNVGTNSDRRSAQGALRFAPQSNFLVLGKSTGVEILDLTNHTNRSVVLGANLEAFWFSDDGQFLVCCRRPKFADAYWAEYFPPLSLINLKDPAFTVTEATGFVPGKGTGDVCVSPNANALFAASRTERSLSISAFGKFGGSPNQILEIGRDDFISGFELSPDGNFLATATGWEGNAVHIFATDPFKFVAKLDLHTAWVSELCFSPDGNTLASASADQTVRLWEMATLFPVSKDETVRGLDTRGWKEKAVLRGHSAEVRTVAYSPNGKFLASGAKDGEILLWDSSRIASQEPRFDFPAQVKWALPLPFQDSIYTETIDRTSSVWSVATLKEVILEPKDAILLRNLAEAIRSEERQPILGKTAEPSELGVVRLVDQENRRELLLQGHLLAVDGVAFTPDGRRLATTSGGREAAKLWEPTTGQELINLAGRGMNLYHPYWTADGNVLVVSSSSPGYSQMWRAPSWEQIEEEERVFGKWPNSELEPPPGRGFSIPDFKRGLSVVSGMPSDPLSGMKIPWLTQIALEKAVEPILSGKAPLTARDALSAQFLAAFHAWNGNETGYLTTTQRLLTLAADTEVAAVASRSAKSYLLCPSTDERLLEQALRLAKRAVALAGDTPNLPWYQLTLGMAEYRRGNMNAALDQLTGAIKGSEGAADKIDLFATTNVFIAMCHVRLGNDPEARSYLIKAASKMGDEPRRNDQGFPDRMHPDFVMFWLLYKEAAALLDAKQQKSIPQKGK